MTAIGLALAVGNLLVYAHTKSRWPSTFLGICYVGVGDALVGYALVRSQHVEAPARREETVPSNEDVLSSFASLVVVLGVGTIVVLVAL